MDQWYEIMENCEVVGYVAAQNRNDALLEWESTHGHGKYRVFAMFLNGQPVLKKTDEYLENSLGERAYKCIYCSRWVREGYSHANGKYVCEYCA